MIVEYCAELAYAEAKVRYFWFKKVVYTLDSSASVSPLGLPIMSSYLGNCN